MNLDHIVRELSKEGSKSVFEGLMKNEETLIAKGFPPISPKWRQALKAFYRDGKLRLVIRAGRRAGKSTTLCRVAVAEGVYGDHKVPPGDIGVFVFVSVKQDEARERLRTIREILDALGIPYSSRANEIQLRDKAVIFRVYPANFRTIVGMTCIGFVADECSRWRDDDFGANPAGEVLASLRPAMATMPNAHEFLSSSPWAQSDAHYEHFEMGNTTSQMVVHGTSWDFNPTLTPERCKDLAGHDEPTFRREYEAIPMTNDATQFFDGAAIEIAMRHNLTLPNYAKYGEFTTAGADFAFTRDWSAICIAHKTGSVYRVGELAIQKPSAGFPLKPSEVCSYFAGVCKRHNVRGIMADRHSKEAIVEYLGGHRIAFLDSPKTPSEAYVRARALMYQECLQLPRDDNLKSRMMEIQAKPRPNGGLSIVIPRYKDAGHSDDISAIVLSVYQRKGKLKQEELPSNMVPEPGQETRPGFRQEGWNDKEIEEVRKLERKLQRKNRIRSYISGL